MSRRRLVLLSLSLFAIAYLAFGLVSSGLDDADTACRIGLTLAVVERGDLDFDEIAPLIGDKGAGCEHYFSNQSPGMSFLAIPAVGLAVKTLHLIKPDAKWARQGQVTPDLVWVERIAALATSSFFAALAVVVLFRTALLFGVSIRGAMFAAILYGFATPTWGWATTLFPHASCGAFLVFGFGATALATMPKGDKWSKIKSASAGLGVGLLLGTAILIEVPAALAAICIAAYGAWRSFRLVPQRMPALLIGGILGAAIAGVPFILYNTALLGSPLSIGYNHSIAQSGVVAPNNGFMGFGQPPEFVEAVKLLFRDGWRLLWLSPILALAPMGWLAMRQARERLTLLLCVSVFFAFLLVGAPYQWWRVGWSTGPQYLVASLPFLALPFAWLWDRSKTIGRWALGALAVVSGIVCFAMAGIDVFSPWDFEHGTSIVPNVLLDTLLPSLVHLKLPNLVFTQLGLNPGVAITMYALLIGGGLLMFWRYAGFRKSSRRKVADGMEPNQEACNRAADEIAQHDHLLPAEQSVFLRFADAIASSRLLDLGVGAGRTTRYLLPRCRFYKGIDYAPAMIDTCRRNFPNCSPDTFVVGDARDLSSEPSDSLDFVLFSYNGLDLIDHGGRERAIAEIHRVLRPGGLFFFSSHSLLGFPFSDPVIQDRNPRLDRAAIERDGWALLVDYRADMITHYIYPEAQLIELQSAGLEVLEVLDMQGNPLNSMKGCNDWMVHYLCRAV